MDDIDYHSIYTQFLAECDKKNRPPAIVTKGFLGKSESPNSKVHVYYLVPSVINDNVVKSILHNSNHPYITKFKIIKKKDQTLDKQLKVESIDYNSSTNFTYTDILRIVDSSAINIILCDSVLLDYNIFDHVQYIPPQTLAVLSSKQLKSDKMIENSEYKYEINNFNGFIFNGKPDIDVPYYVNFYGSRHMFIKKFYTNKFNVVNVAKLIPCYMLEYNTDCLNKDNTYITNPSFSIVIIQPQQNTELINVTIDEKEILRYRDSKPIDSVITFSNIQLDTETILPLIKRIGISELEHTLKINLYQSYHRELERKQQSMIESIQRQTNEMNIKFQLEKEKQEDLFQKHVKQKVDELHDKYQELEKDFDDEFNAIKDERMRELQQTVEKEYEIMRAQRIASIDNESQTLFQALDTQYNELLEQRKEKLENYEKTERDRIDNEINNLYSEKYDEVSKKIEIRRMQLEEEIEQVKETIINKVKEEVRSDYILKYNEEYADAISQMTKFIEYRRNAAIVNIEKELQSMKDRKHRELDAWEKVRHAAVEKHIQEYELQQKKIVDQNFEKYQKSRFEDVELLVQHKYTTDCEENKRKLDEELESTRMKTFIEANQHASQLIEDRITALNAELESIRKERLSSTVVEIQTEKELLFQKMKEEIENTRLQKLRDVEKEANDLAHKLADERESVVLKILESNISVKESEINTQFALKQASAENTYAIRISELEKNMAMKVAQIQQEYENVRRSETAKLLEYEKKFKDMLVASEKRLRDEALSTRYMMIETEMSAKRNEAIKKLNTEFEKSQSDMKKHIAELKQKEMTAIEGYINTQKMLKENELSAWVSNEKHKLETKLLEEKLITENALKEFYDIKKFEFAENFTKETNDIEKSRIAFHNRELERIKEEINADRQNKVQEITNQITEELTDFKNNKREELLMQLDQEIEQIRKDKLDGLADEVKTQAQTLLSNELDNMRKQCKDDIEKELSERRNASIVEYESKIAGELSSFRSNAISKIETELKEYKERRITEIENELKESERKRKIKIREMQELVSRMN